MGLVLWLRSAPSAAPSTVEDDAHFARETLSRLQELTKSYRHNIIASEAFVGYTNGSWTTLGQEKLRGVEAAITVLSPDLSKQATPKEESAFEPSYDGLSDAENVMLLHRDALDPERLRAGGSAEDRFQAGRPQRFSRAPLAVRSAR